MRGVTLNVGKVKGRFPENVVGFIGRVDAMRAARDLCPLMRGADDGLRSLAPDTLVVVRVRAGELVYLFPNGEPQARLVKAPAAP